VVWCTPPYLVLPGVARATDGFCARIMVCSRVGHEHGGAGGG
jgi:hypothetical protein